MWVDEVDKCRFVSFQGWIEESGDGGLELDEIVIRRYLVYIMEALLFENEYS